MEVRQAAEEAFQTLIGTVKSRRGDTFMPLYQTVSNPHRYGQKGREGLGEGGSA